MMEKLGLDSTNKDESVVEEVSAPLDSIKNETDFAIEDEDFFDSVKERVFGGLQKLVIKAIEVSGLEHPAIKDGEIVSDKYHESRDFSDLAGTYFENLIPKGLRSPRKKGRAHSPVTPLITDDYNNLHLNTIQAINLFRREYKSNRQEIFADSIIMRDREPYEGISQEEVTRDGKIQQTLDSAVLQGNRNLIYENIKNSIKPREENIPESQLAIQDIESGLTLDLQALLPFGYKFIPGRLDGFRAKKGENVKDLKDQRVKITRDDFYMSGRRRLVAYGDLTEKGGVLSLFHEIAHSWQNEHIGNFGRSSFESSLKSIKESVLDLSQTTDDSEEIIRDLTLKMETMGLDVESITFSHSYKRVEDGVVVSNSAGKSLTTFLSITQSLRDNNPDSPYVEDFIQSRYAELLSKSGFYTIKSKKISKALDDYVADERDAWAHGLKTLRFLRKQGLDIEPELMSLKDFKGVIDPCLQSYRELVNKDTFNVGMGDRFLRRKEDENSSSSKGLK